MTDGCEYRLFGLRVRSEIPLPDLFPAEGPGAVDVTIRNAAIHCEKREEGLAKEGDALVLTIPEVATYRIANGDEILVDAAPDVPDRNVRLFLLGSAFGALLHQRGLLPLHANAIEIDGKAVAFMGESGAGKSTLAAWFHDRGYRVIADDVCVVRFDDAGSPRAVPGLPRLRLWAEALAKMGRDPSGLARSYVGADEEKYDVPIDREFAAGTDLPLTRLYVLDRASEFAISPVSGLPAAEAVFANTYRGWYASAAGTGQAHWQSAMNLVHKLPVVRVSRPWDLSLLDDQGMRLLDHVREQSKPRPAGSDGTARMNAIEQEPGSICVGCGLCCDGTLHGRATVKPDDEATVRAVALEIEEESGKRFFRQPCPRFSCGSCSVYAERPNVCRGYRCALLEKVDAGDIAAPDARATIERARQLVDRVRTATPEAITPEARAAAMDRLKAQVTLQGSDGDAAASALLDLAVLQHFLDRWFLKEKSEDSRPGERALG